MNLKEGHKHSAHYIISICLLAAIIFFCGLSILREYIIFGVIAFNYVFFFLGVSVWAIGIVLTEEEDKMFIETPNVLDDENY